MPKDPITAKRDEAALLRSYYERGDAVGLFAHLEELFDENAENPDAPEISAWKEFVQDLTNNPTPEKDNFYMDFMRASAERAAELAKEAGKKADDVREHIRNGETEGLELLAPDEKLIDQAGDIFALYKTGIGKKLTNLQLIMAPAKDALLNAPRDISHIQKSYNERYTELITGDPNLEPEVRERYHRLNAEVSNVLPISSSMNEHLKNKSCTVDIYADDGFVFSSVSDSMKQLKEMSDLELEEHIKQLEADESVMKACEGTLKDFGAVMKDLGKELEEKTPEEERGTDAYKQLKAALKKCENLSINTRPENVKENMDKVAEAAGNLPDKELGNTLLSRFEAGRKSVEQSFADGADAIIAKNGQRSNSESKTIAKDIARAKAERDYRTIQKLPETVKELNTLKNKIETCTKEQDEIVAYKESARRAMKLTARAAEVLDKDQTARSIPEKDREKHSEYLAMTGTSKALSEMDIEKLSPAQILEKMRQAKAAADRYVQTHAGLSNITKGWTGEARERINNARNISANLDKQIKVLEGSADSLEKKTAGKTIEERFAELSAMKQAFRIEASQKRLEVLASPETKIGNRLRKYDAEYAEHVKKRESNKQGTMPESAAFVAAESIRKLKNASVKNAPFTENHKDTALKHIGRIVAYDTGMFQQEKNKDEKGFKKFVGDVGKDQNFIKAVELTIGEINRENIKKFCADPSMSGKIRDNFVKLCQNEIKMENEGPAVSAEKGKDLKQNLENPGPAQPMIS